MDNEVKSDRMPRKMPPIPGAAAAKHPIVKIKIKFKPGEPMKRKVKRGR